MKATLIPVLAMFLRLGRKYEIKHVRQQTVKRLATVFPSDLDGCFEALAQWVGPIIGISAIPGAPLYIVNLIRENELLVHLPPAILLGCILRDPITGRLSLFFPSPDTQQTILSYADIELCHKNFIELVHLQATETLSWTKWDAPTCGISACKERHQTLRRRNPGSAFVVACRVGVAGTYS